MKTLFTISLLFWTGISYASSINCQVTNEGTVTITMTAPHPNHAMMKRPDGETVWLQTDPEYVHEQIPNFSELKKWVITPESNGTVYVDGKATVQPIFRGNGKYYLYIADNLETEPENTQYMYCYFLINN